MFDDPLSQLVSFSGKLIWVGAIAAVLLWGSRWLRQRARGVVEKRGVDENLVTIIDNVVRIVVYLVIGLLVLAAVTGDAGAAVIALGLLGAAVTLSLQDVLRNFVSGVYLLVEKPFEPGDTIEVEGETGKVDRVDIRTTVFTNSAKEEVFVPNFKIFSDVLKRKPGFQAKIYHVHSTDPAHESFEAIWDAALSVQSVDEVSPSVKITGTKDDDVDFEVTIWEQTGVSQSAAFIAAVKSKLPDASVRVAKSST